MENKPKSWVLWVGLAIPVVMIVIIAIYSYVPSVVNTKYDFLYYLRDYSNNYCVPGGEVFTVKNQQIAIASTTLLVKGSECRFDAETDPPRIYRYDTSKDTILTITYADAKKLKIDNNPVSPDGVSVQRGGNYNAGIFEIFGGYNNSYNQMYLKAANSNARQLNMDTGNTYNFILIGWVAR
ncbi:MAG: hypothetical protein WCO10_02050 [bacterium]